MDLSAVPKGEPTPVQYSYVLVDIPVVNILINHDYASASRFEGPETPSGSSRVRRVFFSWSCSVNGNHRLIMVLKSWTILTPNMLNYWMIIPLIIINSGWLWLIVVNYSWLCLLVSNYGWSCWYLNCRHNDQTSMVLVLTHAWWVHICLNKYDCSAKPPVHIVPPSHVEGCPPPTRSRLLELGNIQADFLHWIGWNRITKHHHLTHNNDLSTISCLMHFNTFKYMFIAWKILKTSMNHLHERLGIKYSYQINICQI